MSSTPYFLYFILMFLASLHQTHGQACDPDLDYHCINGTAYESCLNGSAAPDSPIYSCGTFNCEEGCEYICVEPNSICLLPVTKLTTIETSSMTTELTTKPPTTTTEITTELTTEETSTTEIKTTSMPTTMRTEVTTEITMETATELTNTAMSTMPTTESATTTKSTTWSTETSTDLPTEETSSTTTANQITTGPPTSIATSTASTDIPPTEAPFTCESAGEFQDLGNCSNFYLCIPLSSGDFVYIMFSCPDGSQFDSVSKKCSQNATCIYPSCNDFGFYCTSTSQVQFCYDSNPPSGEVFTCPTNTYCSMDCQYPCWADIPCTVATESSSTSTTVLPNSTVTLPPTATEFPSTFTTAMPTATVTLPPTTDESPSTSTTALSTPTVTLPPSTTKSSTTTTTVLPTSTLTLPQTTTLVPFVCSETGRFPDPVNCSLYYVCSPKSSGGFYTLHFACPASSLYNPSIHQCSYNFTCSSAELVDISSSTVSSIVTTTSRPFTCQNSGRFADPEDCKSYYLCSPKSSGGFYELHYQCPPSSTYNENTRLCSTASSGNC